MFSVKRAGPSPSGHSLAIQGIFPWCFTPELYAAKPGYIESLAAFVRGRPPQPLEAFLQQSSAVIGHDAESGGTEENDEAGAPSSHSRHLTSSRHPQSNISVSVSTSRS